jgi:hypothetical protein
MIHSHLDGKLETLVELRQRYDGQRSTWDDLDNKIGTLFGAGSLLLSIVSALELGKLQPSPLSWAVWGPVAVAGMLYGLMVFVLLRAYFPANYRYPIKSDWNWLGPEIYQRQDEKLLLRLISQYLEAIKDNDRQIKGKGTAVKQATILLGTQVGLLLLAGLLEQIIG